MQTGFNEDPGDESEGPESNQCLCDKFWWALIDANFNVLGLVDEGGTLDERYEYTPYGVRTVFKSAGTEDPLCKSPVMESQRHPTGMPWGLCDVGHQGLFFDKEWGWSNNRARPLPHVMARFPVRDPAGYVDGMGLYQPYRGNPVGRRDSLGKSASAGCNCGPDMTEFLADLVDYTIVWGERQHERGFTMYEAQKWLYTHLGQFDWTFNNGYKVQGVCPTGDACVNTYSICGECVHDHWIGNFMYGFMGRLLMQPDWLMNAAAEEVQGKWFWQDEDPPWDKAGYALGRDAYQDIYNPKGSHDICAVVKADSANWKAANDTSVKPWKPAPSSGGSPYLILAMVRLPEFHKYPEPHASGYKDCKPCPARLPLNKSTVLPGGAPGLVFDELDGSLPPAPASLDDLFEQLPYDRYGYGWR